MKKLRLAICLLALIGLADSAYLTILKVQLMSQGIGCPLGGCDVVNQSPYALIAGVPVALLGFVTYAIILALGLFWYDAQGSWERWLGWGLLAVSGWGMLFSAYLTAIELFVLQAICPFCLVSAVAITAIFALTAIEVMRKT
ncbi:MAG: vitamin K epoxide reductase family protein [Chloroflexi bacterium]|nr:vitamin K epoxide reductase family protein [Chloroflexota bacterium]